MGAVSLSACGDGESTATPPAGQPNQVSESEFSSARDAYDLKLAGCLREKGHDVKDPKPGEGIQESSAEINAAASECMAEIGDPPTVAPSKQEAAKQRQRLLDQVKCLREKGYEVEDPGSEMAFTIPEDAKQEDVDACFAG